MELIPFLLFYPPVTGYYASTRGYRFWPWFFIGLFLPIIASVILMFLKDKSVNADPEPEIVFEHGDKVLYKK